MLSRVSLPSTHLGRGNFELTMAGQLSKLLLTNQKPPLLREGGQASVRVEVRLCLQFRQLLVNRLF